MEQNDHPASARPKPRLTRAQYMRRKRLRLARNWAILLLVCAAVVALMTKGILWLLPKANALLAGPQSFEAASYDGTAYAFDADDARLVLVNANLPYAEEPAPALAAVTDDSTIQLEAEAAEACRTMLEAAKADGIELVLNAGYLDVDGRSAVYETQKQAYLDAGKTEEQAASLAEDIQPRAECSEHGTGYAVDILSADYTTRDTGFAATRAYEWLTAYAAEYGLSAGPAGRDGRGVRALALAVCGHRKRPRHPRQRPEPGRIPDPAKGIVTKKLPANTGWRNTIGTYSHCAGRASLV